jgi:hypothetical protein
LELAARENEAMVDSALRAMLKEEQASTVQAVWDCIECREGARPVTDVFIEATELSSFDVLFDHKEVWDDFADGGEAAACGVPERTSLAHVL